MTNSTPTALRTQPNAIPQWQLTIWEDYLADRDDPSPERVRLFFNQGNWWALPTNYPVKVRNYL